MSCREPIRGEIRAVSCQSSTEAMFLAVLTEKSALFSVTVRCDVTGKPDMQSVVQLDSHMQQEGDLIGRELDVLATGKGCCCLCTYVLGHFLQL